MTLLLVNTNRETRPTPVMPIGMLRVAEAAEAAGIAVQVLDLAFQKHPLKLLARKISECSPRLIGLSVRNIDNADARKPIYYLEFVRSLVLMIRGISKAPIVLGGAGVSMAPELVQEAVGADCTVSGPGEAAILELWEKATQGEPIASVVAGAPGAFKPSADFARWLDLGPYRRRATALGVQSRRGCPYGCVYCNYATIEGAVRYDLQPVEAVVEAIERGVRTTGIRHVEFVDSTFNSPPAYARELCEGVAGLGMKLRLSASGITPRFCDRETLLAMKAAGFSSMWCSPDTASPSTIKSYGKGFKQEHLVRMAQLSEELGIQVLWSFLFGGPGETQETVKETLQFVRESIHPNQAVMFAARMRIYPGSHLARTSIAEGNPPPVLDPKQPGQWYLSPEVDGVWLDGMLTEARNTQSNVMYMDVTQERQVPVLQLLNAALRRPVPVWADYPRIRRVLMGLGIDTVR